MPKILTIHDYLTEAELQERYRHASNPVEKSHWHCLWLLATGKKVTEVAVITTYTARWVRELIHRYNELGPTAMLDQRPKIKGAPPLLTKELQAELDQTLQQPPPDKGSWTGPKVAEWISTKIGRTVAKQRGWDYFQRLNYSRQQPRPHHYQADKEAQAEFKKNCQSE